MLDPHRNYVITQRYGIYSRQDDDRLGQGAYETPSTVTEP